MDKAAFFIKDYKFPKVMINLENMDESDKDSGIKVLFEPSGQYSKKDQLFLLHFDFKAFSSQKHKEPFAAISCLGYFQFENTPTLKEVPQFFYRNSIAILFPYLRAYISLVTNQANIPPFILPTLNLSSLEEPLLENTVEK